MNTFSKKTSIILISISTLLLLIGSILILVSNELYSFTYEFLSNKVFHRDFDFDKWLPSIESFFLIPSFLVIVFNALFFTKYSDKSKMVLISIFAIDILFMTLFANYTSTRLHVNSDLGSEILLGKECVLEHNLWPRGWFYSTEFRFLNTQIFSAFGFLFTNDFDTVKTVQSFFTIISLFFAMLYLLNQLSIQKLWLKLFTCFLTVIPFSIIAWHVGAGENYYVPHAIFSMIYIATFLKLINNKELKHKKAFTVFFYVWAFLSGLSSIRYIILFVLPFAITIIWLEARKKEISITDFKNFWLKNKKIFLVCAGLILSGFGYLANNSILQRIYTFSQWNTMSFNTFGDTTLSDILHGIINVFGYQENIAVLSPGGIINCLVYLALILFIIYTAISLKNDILESNRIVIVFFIISFVLNTFLHLNVDYTARYYYPLILYVFPCISIMISNSSLSSLRKWALGTVWSILILSSTFATLQNRIDVDDNKDKHGVTKFLLDNNYSFGYATFWNSTVFTYLTNGKVEVGNLYKDHSEGEKIWITPTYKYDEWLSPKRWYTDDFDGKNIFLLVSNDQYELSKDLNIFKNGKLVYEDEYYKIFDYINHETFKNSF